MDCAAVARVEGWYCAVLIDLRAAQCVLLQDPLGGKPVFYHQDEAKTTFSNALSPMVGLLGKADFIIQT